VSWIFSLGLSQQHASHSLSVYFCLCHVQFAVSFLLLHRSRCCQKAADSEPAALSLLIAFFLLLPFRSYFHIKFPKRIRLAWLISFPQEVWAWGVTGCPTYPITRPGVPPPEQGLWAAQFPSRSCEVVSRCRLVPLANLGTKPGSSKNFIMFTHGIYSHIKFYQKRP
jgi:hypothetical protein